MESAPCSNVVTWVPSLRHPMLVPDFSRRVASRLDLPAYAVVVNRAERPEQKTMANSVQQAHNVDGAFAIHNVKVPPEPVLLIDDLVDSRWTFAVCTWLLRLHGSGVVWPLALAQAGGGR